jgi:hypothetical protein
MIREPNKAAQKPWTSKPGMTPDTIINNRALMTKMKRPKLRMVKGRVRRMRMGRKKALRIPRIAAEKKALQNPFTVIPSTT